MSDRPVNVLFLCIHKAAGEVWPFWLFWPGHPATAHWGYADPSGGTGSEAQKLEAFRQTLHAIRRRLGLLVNLPPRSLDKLVLQTHARELAGS